MSRVSAAIYTQCMCVALHPKRLPCFFFSLRRQDLRRGASRHPARLQCLQSFRMELCLITSALSNKKCGKNLHRHPKGVPFFSPTFIYGSLQQPHWPRAIIGRERDRQLAGGTDDSSLGRKSTGSTFFSFQTPQSCFVEWFHNKAGRHI